MISGFSVFDAHVHVQPHEELLPRAREAILAGRNDLGAIEEALASPGGLLAHMDAEGIERVALINYVAPEVMGLTAKVNPWILRFTAPHRDRLVPVGGLHPRHEKDAEGAARRLVDEGIGAFKIHPPHMELAANAYRFDVPALAAVYRVAGEAGIPVLVHTGTSVFPGARNVYADPLACDDVAVDFPRTRLVLCHAGRPIWYQTAFFLARRHPNVFLDLSGIPPGKLLEALPRLEEIAGKCVWGSDWPSMGVTSMRRNVELFLSLPLPDDARRKVLFENAAGLLR